MWHESALFLDVDKSVQYYFFDYYLIDSNLHTYRLVCISDTYYAYHIAILAFKSNWFLPNSFHLQGIEISEANSQRLKRALARAKPATDPALIC